MPPVRRPAAVAAPPQPAPSGIGFGSLDFYSGGFSLPEGDYAMEHNVVMHQFTKQDGTVMGQPRLGVMLTAYPLSGGEPLQQFLSMGTKAHLSFAPNASGKGVDAVPGAPAQTAPRSTNWQLYLKSMYDTGLPEGVFVDDISTIDGIWVHTQSVDEPEERKGFGGAATGDVQEEPRKGPQKIPIVSAILDGGKPWEGTGGFPAAGAPAAAPVASVKAASAKPAPRPVARPAAVAAPAAAASDDDVMAAAVSAVTDVITETPEGTQLPKLALRTGTFKKVQASHGAEVANSVISTFFASDAALNGVLNQLGYSVVAGYIKQL